MMTRKVSRTLEIEKHTEEMFKKLFLKLKPPEDIPISEWADKYRRLPAESSAEPGRWRTSKTPYMKKIMDVATDNSVKKVVIQASAQVGKSELLLNILGYYTHIDPSPILVIQPTVETGKNFSKERIKPTFRDTPVLSKILSGIRSTIQKIDFVGGFIAIVGANAPSALASRPIRILLCDEVDRYPLSAGDEGDPLTLGEKRTTTFPYTSKKIFVSTPTIKDVSRIEQEFQTGSMEEWQLPCPGCGEYQTITWDKIHFERDKKTKVLLDDQEILCLCEHCGELNNEVSWKKGMGRGQWKETVTNPEIRSFHLSSLISPWKSWREVVEGFLKAKNDPEQLKVWTNTELGETFAVLGDGISGLKLLERREKYGCELPDGVLVLTAGIDVQDDRFEIEVVGWGRNYESWGIEYYRIFGDLDKKAVWNQLATYLNKTFKFKDGTELSIANSCIDTGGHYTTEVYQFCKRPHKFNIRAIKGRGGTGLKFLYSSSDLKDEKIKLQILGVNSGKETIMSRLKTTDIGEGYCHFPKETGKGYDLAYFDGLTSEHQVTKIVNGRPTRVWELKKKNARNEPFDIRNYATAALELLMPIEFDALEELLVKGINHSKKQESKVDDGSRKNRRTTQSLL